MSAARVRNSETMFHTRTTKRADGLTRICNPSAFNCPRAETDDKKFALAVSKAAKLPKRRKSFRNKTFIFSCQTRDFSRLRLAFLVERKIFYSLLFTFNKSNAFNFDPRIPRQPRRLHCR